MLAKVRGAGGGSTGRRRPIVWEDAFESIPTAIGADAVVEVWADGTALNRALVAGHDTILALGWYLDRQVPVDGQTGWFWLDTWVQMHGLKLPGRTNASDHGRLLGGEANMWSEQVSPLSVDARVWPRACAVAERLWSRAAVNDSGAAATRLARHRCRLAAQLGGVGPIWADYCSADYHSVPPHSTITPMAATTILSDSRGLLPRSHYGSIAIAAWLAAATALWFWLGRSSGQTDAPLPGPNNELRGGIEGREDEASPLLPQRGARGKNVKPGVPIKQRVQSLDVFRGFNIALMIFVDMTGAAFPSIHHSPWNGIRLADFVMPFFDFMVGVSLAISLKRVQEVTATGGTFRRRAFMKATTRFVKIFVLGVLTQGGISLINFNLAQIRIMGILQRVAVCYYAVALMEIFLPRATQFDPSQAAGRLLRQAWLLLCRYRWHWLAAGILVAINTAVMYGVDVTAADGMHCGRGNLTPVCNAASYADRLTLGVDHMYFPTNGGDPGGKDMTFQRMPECSGCSPGKCPKEGAPQWCNSTPFDPEGLVSSLNAIVTTVIGSHCGHVIVLLVDGADRVSQWNLAGWVQLTLGLVLHLSGAIVMNTDLYSISYILVSGAAACLTLAFLYYLVDVLGYAKRITTPFKAFGMNAILMYLLAEGGLPDTLLNIFYVGNPLNNLQYVLWPTGDLWGNSDDELPSEPTRDPYVMCWTLSYIAFWMVVAWVLHLRGIYVKI
mmetsp:Transcript_29659/g.88748  ORF Transcript_29659/g.88748 Transcript_29659/m.88748 type:complete len:726 (-) Transcript_29659:538-2715(-)